ncbi:hypothetical protein TNCV_4759431 [Trichonephila clavipes]|nr:hypothetical protein TNCV_4759431 [Trichonephila clavipes]
MVILGHPSFLPTVLGRQDHEEATRGVRSSQFVKWNEKVSNHGSIPITIDCNVVAFIVFEEVRTNDSTSP